MRKSLAAFIVAWSVPGAILAFVSPSVADTRVITAAGSPPNLWKSAGNASKPNGTPLVVDNLKIGDIIDFQISAGAISHGVITINQVANLPPAQNENKNFVWACGQPKPDKAVLREIECGAASQFGKPFKGTMKLEVLDTFKADTNFWCFVHKFQMTGTLKLAAAPAPTPTATPTPTPTPTATPTPKQ